MMNRRDSRMGRLRRRGWPEDEALATASRAGTLVVPVSKEPAMRPVVPCSIALILALFGPLAAQVDHEHHGERLGRVAFPTSCGPAAQAHVERGVALLHSFWYEPAGDAFRDAVAADSTCAMGYWGQAMSLLHPLWTPPAPAELTAGLAVAERGPRASADAARAGLPRGHRRLLQGRRRHRSQAATPRGASPLAPRPAGGYSPRHRSILERGPCGTISPSG